MTAEVKTYVNRSGEVFGKSWNAVTNFSEANTIAIDADGFSILGPSLESICHLRNREIIAIDPPKSGLLRSRNAARKYGFMRNSGETVHPFEFEHATPFEGRFSLAKRKGMQFLLGADGDVIDLTHLHADMMSIALSERNLVVQIVDGKSIVYDHNFKLRFSSSLAIGAFHGGYAAFTIGGKSGLIDENGEIRVGAAYDAVTDVTDGAFLTYSGKSSCWTLRNMQGEQISELRIIEFAPISEGICFLIADRRRMAVSVSNGDVLWSDDYLGSLAEFSSRLARCDDRNSVRFLGRSFEVAFSFPKSQCSYAGRFDDSSDYCPVHIQVT